MGGMDLICQTREVKLTFGLSLFGPSVRLSGKVSKTTLKIVGSDDEQSTDREGLERLKKCIRLNPSSSVTLQLADGSVHRAKSPERPPSVTIAGEYFGFNPPGLGRWDDKCHKPGKDGHDSKHNDQGDDHCRNASPGSEFVGFGNGFEEDNKAPDECNAARKA